MASQLLVVHHVDIDSYPESYYLLSVFVGSIGGQKLEIKIR